MNGVEQFNLNVQREMPPSPFSFPGDEPAKDSLAACVEAVVVMWSITDDVDGA